jgi:hypothetical protein
MGGVIKKRAYENSDFQREEEPRSVCGLSVPGAELPGKMIVLGKLSMVGSHSTPGVEATGSTTKDVANALSFICSDIAIRRRK